ncbi:hypothetical protein [Chitinophaga filiformis]|uniref:HmuY protein n=1 Tax=Chitinophaga filiformis TaxID=104663 RepID=A0A1G7HA99_CHIFI|nr:hypothetical protein [Chitinophaga filiformis]SDE97243.1 hypothetical protein SAMN04488121_101377 [Chitinophaga filiformis]
MKILDTAPKSVVKTTKNIARSLVAMALVSVAVFSSCQKEGNQAVPSLPGADNTIAATNPGSGQTVAFNCDSTYGTVTLDASGVYNVANFFQGVQGTTGNPPHVAHSTYYYSLADNDGGCDGYDLIFNGTANADISVPSGYTLQYTASTSFANVTASTVGTTVSVFGYNRILLAPPTGNTTINTAHPGWYNYDVVNHIVYPIAEWGVEVTLIVTTDAGVKYKVQLQDLYSNGTPNSTVQANNFPFFKFRYKRLN